MFLTVMTYILIVSIILFFATAGLLILVIILLVFNKRLSKYISLDECEDLYLKLTNKILEGGRLFWKLLMK